jgi:hypothetical protein
MPSYKACVRYFQDHPEDDSQSYEDVSETFETQLEADNYIAAMRVDTQKHILSIQVYEDFFFMGSKGWRMISDSAINYNVNIRH